MDDSDGFLLKLNAAGNFEWAKVLVGRGSNNLHTLAINALGDIYGVGDFEDDLRFNQDVVSPDLQAPMRGSNTFIFKAKARR